MLNYYFPFAEHHWDKSGSSSLICCLNWYILKHEKPYFEVLKANYVAEVSSSEICNVEEIPFKID